MKSNLRFITRTGLPDKKQRYNLQRRFKNKVIISRQVLHEPTAAQLCGTFTFKILCLNGSKVVFSYGRKYILKVCKFCAPARISRYRHKMYACMDVFKFSR